MIGFALKLMGVVWLGSVVICATVIGLEELNRWRERRHQDRYAARGIDDMERWLEEV